MSEFCEICGGDCAGANPPVWNCPRFSDNYVTFTGPHFTGYYAACFGDAGLGAITGFGRTWRQAYEDLVKRKSYDPWD